MVYYLFVSLEFLQFFVGDNSCRTQQLFSPGRNLSWQHPLFQEDLFTWRQPEHNRQQHSWEFVSSFQGFLSEQAQELNVSPETSLVHGHQNHHPLCPRSMWWQIKAAALVHIALAEFTLPKPCVSLICSSTQFLLLQIQLIFDFISCSPNCVIFSYTSVS